MSHVWNWDTDHRSLCEEASVAIVAPFSTGPLGCVKRLVDTAFVVRSFCIIVVNVNDVQNLCSLLLEIDRLLGLVLYVSSRACCGSKDLATSRISGSLQIRRAIGSVADRRQCCPSPYCRSVDLAIIYIFAGSRPKKKK